MSTYSNLKIEEITLGDSGWGTSTTNNLLAIQQALQSATLATGNFTSNVATLPWTNTSATTNTPRAMVLNITATLTGAGTVNLPAITGGKAYLVINNSSGGYAVTVKVTGLTGVSVPNGKAMWLWNNGTDVVDGVNYISSLALGAALPLTSGGTGQTTANAAFNALAPVQTTASGKYLKSDGTNTAWDQIDISTADITGTLPIANGGTGQTTANAAFNALAPSQASASGKYLTSDGTNTSWATVNALPTQTGNSGKVLGTDGTNASWTDSILGARVSGYNRNTLVGPNNAQAMAAAARDNVVLGYIAFQSSTGTSTAGSYNVVIGSTAAVYLNGTTGNQASYNTILGVNAGNGVSGSSTYSYNTLVGDHAGFSLTTGSNNTFIGNGGGAGTSTGYYMTTGSNNVILGNFSGNEHSLDIRTLNNYVVISDGDGNQRLVVNGSGAWSPVATGTSFGTSGQVLASQGSSSPPTWTTLPTFGTMATQDANNVAITGGTITAGISASTFSSGTVSASAVYQRVTAIADGTSVTINADTTDMATQANTQAAGTLTINAPTGTIQNGQKLVFRLQSTNVQTFSWNAVFAGSSDLALPTASSGSSKYDYMGFIYNSTAAKWQMLAKNFGF